MAIRQTILTKAPVEDERSTIINKRLFFKEFHFECCRFAELELNSKGEFMLHVNKLLSRGLCMMILLCKCHISLRIMLLG